MGFNRLLSQHTSGTRAYPTILLDGGLGTTLQDVFHKDITHPLWSARLVDQDEESIVAAHLSFLRAGSQVILTSTYQAAYETFRRAEYTDSDAEKLMRKSVALAAKARRKYQEVTPHVYSDASSCCRPLIALSLGPYGATLTTAAEFTGKYPTPYGPSPSSLGPASPSEEQSYEDALAAFHFTRLLVYARDAVTWNAIDIVAFETVPLVTEAKAIRRAVARLEAWFQETIQDPTLENREMKPWYISFVFPGENGAFPQYHKPHRPMEESTSLDEWRPYTASEVAQSTFLPQYDGSQKMATPDAIGINCTQISDISRLFGEFITAVKDILITLPKCFGDELPWLALSPNGGVAYDLAERKWTDGGQGNLTGSSEEWARSVETRLQPHRDTPQWAGIFGGLLLGGCCKTGPDDIRALEELLCK